MKSQSEAQLLKSFLALYDKVNVMDELLMKVCKIFVMSADYAEYMKECVHIYKDELEDIKERMK